MCFICNKILCNILRPHIVNILQLHPSLCTVWFLVTGVRCVGTAAFGEYWLFSRAHCIQWSANSSALLCSFSRAKMSMSSSSLLTRSMYTSDSVPCGMCQAAPWTRLFSVGCLQWKATRYMSWLCNVTTGLLHFLLFTYWAYYIFFCLLTELSVNCTPCSRWCVRPTPVKMLPTTIKSKARINLSGVKKHLARRDRYADIIWSVCQFSPCRGSMSTSRKVYPFTLATTTSKMFSRVSCIPNNHSK